MKLHQSRTFSEELDLLKDKGMSIALRQQIAIYLFKDYLQKIPFFQLATDNVLGMICMQLHPVIYMPDDYIIREGDIGKELFMIVKGIVRVMPPNQSTDPAAEKKILLGEGDFFGEIGVVMEVERTRSVRAECMAELCILSRDGFDKILVEFPEFATAMKRLIIKRVGEMWQSDADGSDRMERMTKLADWKMKRAVQTQNNMQKLRSSAQILHAFRPKGGPHGGAAALTTVPDIETTVIPGKEPREATRNLEALSLEPITELESEPNSRRFQRKSTLENMLEDISAADTTQERLASKSLKQHEAPVALLSHREEEYASPPEACAPLHTQELATATVVPGVPPEVELHTPQEAAAAAEPKAASHKVFRKFEKALHQMEKKMDTRLGDLDAKIAQLLQLLVPSTSQTNSSGAPGIMTDSYADPGSELVGSGASELNRQNADSAD